MAHSSYKLRLKKKKLNRGAPRKRGEQAEKVHRMTHSYNTRYQKKVTMEAHPLYQQFLTMDFKTLCAQIRFIEAQPYWYRDDDVLRYAEHALDILRDKNAPRNTALMMRFMGYHDEVIVPRRLLTEEILIKHLTECLDILDENPTDTTRVELNHYDDLNWEDINAWLEAWKKRVTPTLALCSVETSCCKGNMDGIPKIWVVYNNLDEERQCDFCGCDVGEYGGNNPAPLEGTKCCDDCNETRVRPARMALTT